MGDAIHLTMQASEELGKYRETGTIPNAFYEG
jgi:hypothetical protein